MTKAEVVAGLSKWFLPLSNGLIFSIGVPGNLLALRVLSHKLSGQSSVHGFLFWLVVADLLVCLCRMINFFISLATGPTSQDSGSDLNCRILSASTYFAYYVTLFLFTAVAYDCYKSSLKPPRSKTAPPKTKLLIRSCYLSALLVASVVPVFGRYNHRENGPFCKVISPTWLIELGFYSLFVLTILACFCLGCLYVAISRAVRRKARVESDENLQQSSFGLVSVAARVNLTVPQIPSLVGLGLESGLCDGGDVASSSAADTPSCSSDLRDPAKLPKNKENDKLHNDDGKRRVRFNSALTRRYDPPQPPVRRLRLAKVLIAKIVSFAIFWSPLLVVIALDHFAFPSAQIWLNFCIHLAVLNSALDSLIFAVASRQFRADLKELFAAVRCFWEPRFQMNRSNHVHHPYWVR